MHEVLRAPNLDERLHAERLDSDRKKRTHRLIFDQLPDGAMIILPERPDHAGLVWRGRVLAWSPEGYAAATVPPGASTVETLTPPSTLAALRAGYGADVHPSVSGTTQD